MSDIRVVWDDSAVKLWCDHAPAPVAMMARVTAQAVVTMKSLIPVSPVYPVYAQPIPAGSSKGPVYRGRGLARPGGPPVSRTRSAGDLPLPVSGRLRASVSVAKLPDGSIIIGPTAKYAPFVNDGTPPHVIRSTGPWPLRNRATGQVFGPLVHHPGTTGAHFIERTAEAIGQVTEHV